MEPNKPKTLFIVEDNVMFAESMKIMLENKGYVVHLFHTGEQMISSWTEDPDVILLDFYIETELGTAMNGEQILRFIRRISRSLPVIILTSNTDISEATQLLKLGAVDFIVKDEELPEQLDKTLNQVFESFRLREEMNRTKLQVKKYRERFLLIVLMVALAVMTLLWLFS